MDIVQSQGLFVFLERLHIQELAAVSCRIFFETLGFGCGVVHAHALALTLIQARDNTKLI